MGSHIAKTLSRDWSVRTFDRPGSPFHGVGEFYSGNVHDLSALARAMEACHAVIYLVHESGDSPYLDRDDLVLVRNMELLVVAVQAAKTAGVSNFLFFSSGGAVYGIPNQVPVAEDHICDPISSYGVAKASMEMYLRSIARARDFNTLVVRPSNPYGPGQNPFRKQGVISIFTQRILAGKEIELWGDGLSVKDYLYIDDFSEGVAVLIGKGFDNRAYNIGAGCGISLLEIIRVIERVTGKKACVKHLSARRNDVTEVTLDISRITDRTGWVPRVDLEKGVTQTVLWVQNYLSIA